MESAESMTTRRAVQKVMEEAVITAMVSHKCGKLGQEPVLSMFSLNHVWA
jgi:hypothetical protein